MREHPIRAAMPKAIAGGAVHGQGGDVTLGDPTPEPFAARFVETVAVIVIFIREIASNLRGKRKEETQEGGKPVEMPPLESHGNSGENARNGCGECAESHRLDPYFQRAGTACG